MTRLAIVGLVLILLCAILLPLTGCSRGLTTEQKLEDFRYLFDTLMDNHPLLATKARLEGYDWLAHEGEFETWVRESRNDSEFAAAIARMLMLLNNRHTFLVSPQVYGMIKALPPEQAAFHKKAAETNDKRVAYWWKLAVESIQATPMYEPLPLDAVYSGGEYVVVNLSDQLEEQGIAPGMVVTRIEGVPVHDAVADFRGVDFLRYDPFRKLLFRDRLQFRRAGLFENSPVEVTFASDDGGQVTVPVPLLKQKSSPLSLAYPTNLPSLEKARDNVYTAVLAEGKMGYIHIDRMTNFEQSTAEGAEIREFLETNVTLPALIFDIRGNGGGDDRFWMGNIVAAVRPGAFEVSGAQLVRDGEYLRQFDLSDEAEQAIVQDTGLGFRSHGEIIEKSQLEEVLTPDQFARVPPEVLGPGFSDTVFCSRLVLEPKEPMGYEGRLFLLTDRTVFSAAEDFAAFCRATNWATVVGECTGGEGGGMPVPLVLPNSMLIMMFPSDLGLNPDWSGNEDTHTIPHVVVEQSPEDLVTYAERLLAGETFDYPDPTVDTALRECIRLALEAVEGR